MTLNDFVNIIFIPSFGRNRRNWSLNIADDIEDVRSLAEARQFTAALSDYTVTPDDSRAGQQELIPIPPPPQIPAPGYRDDMANESRTGVIFYVTQKEFTRFSQELALMEEHTSSVYDYLPFSEVKDFECMQFILNDMVASPHFAQKDLKTVNRPWSDGFLSPLGLKFNKIERLVPSQDKEKELALQRVAKNAK